MVKIICCAALLVAPLAMSSAALAQDGPIVTKSGALADPAPGKGMVVFYRTGSIMGAALGCTVREGEGADERQVARLGAGKYWAHMAEPGKHAYRTEGEAKDVLNMEIEPGETYFVRCQIGAGVMAGRANIKPATREEFAAKAKGFKLWEGPRDLASAASK